MFERVCVGMLGGGQLARMSAYAAYRLGFDVAILEKEERAPAMQITQKRFAGWIDNDHIVREFCAVSDIVTLENEFVDVHRLSFIEALGKKVVPGGKTIGLIQDKLLQKKTLAAAGIPVPRFQEVTGETTYQSLSKKFGKRFLLKSRQMGYDGYGNALVGGEDDYRDAMKRLTRRHAHVMAEEHIDFAAELAVSVARTSMQTKTYPVVETIQRNHICHTVIAPAQIDEKIRSEARRIAVEAVEAVSGIGIFGIELFLCNDGSVLVNEMAPRPHNSAHYTIEACVTSQFENHIRAVLGLPLGSTEMVAPAAVMVNLLGKTNGPGTLKDYHEVLHDENVHLHLYGKEHSRIGRKMGHITLLGSQVESTLRRALALEQHIII